MKNVFIKVITRCLSKIIKKDSRLVTIIFRGYSGSNLSPIIEKLGDEKYENYKIKIIYDGRTTRDFLSKEINKFDLFKARVQKYKYVFRSNLVITTHGFYKLRNDTTMINLWHGIPIKTMSLMNKGKTDAINSIQDDYFISTSCFFNTVMNSCLGIMGDKYVITGYPRNDYLFHENGIENLNNLLDMQIEGKIVLFIPTYRNGRTHEDINNIFNFPYFDADKFNNFLEKNDITLLLKLHPNEEHLILSKYDDFVNSRIILISGDNLEGKEMDLYKVINAVDLLITDYSSIYFDYLLLDRPVIFAPMDLQNYRENRGLLLEPYEFWTPGYKCLNQEDLQEKILLELNNPDYFREQRKIIRDIFHKYQDGNSTERVMGLINDIMKSS